ncbi:MAG: M28 family peptidase [candidate division WOR-3 bacterium]
MTGKIAYDLMLKLKGERVSGTENHKKANNILKQFLKDLKVKYETIDFPLYISDIGKGSVTLGSQRYEGVPYGLTVPYSVEGILEYAESFEQIQNIDQNFENKILIMKDRPNMSKFPVLKEKKIKGIITASRSDDLISSLHLSSWMIEKNCIIPMIDIKYSDVLKLMENVGKRVKIEGKGKTYKTRSENIIAKIDGTKKTEEKIIVMGHTDTVPRSPGGSDNSGGIGIMAELLAYFSKNRTKREIIFSFFSGEELGLWGSRFFVARNEKDLKNYILGINFDVAGDPFGTTQCIVTANDYLVNVINFVSKLTGSSINVSKDIYSSDNMPFSLKGVPTINLLRAGGVPSRFIHTDKDSVDHISEKGVLPLINFGKFFIETVGNSSINPIEKNIDEGIKKKIEGYFTGRGTEIKDVVDSLKKIK